MSSTSSIALAAPSPSSAAQSRRFSRPSGTGRTRGASTKPATPSSAATLICGSRPNSRTEPAVGRISPSIIRSEVVLPAPFGPEVAEDVAALDRQVDVVDRDDLAVALDQPADLDRRRLGHATTGARAAVAPWPEEHRAEHRVVDAAALEAQHRAERGVELLALRRR